MHWFSIFYRLKNNNNYPTNQFVSSTVLFVFVIFPLIPIIMECFLNILFLKTNNCKNCLACFKKKLYVPHQYHFKKFFFLGKPFQGISYLNCSNFIWFGFQKLIRFSSSQNIINYKYLFFFIRIPKILTVDIESFNISIRYFFSSIDKKQNKVIYQWSLRHTASQIDIKIKFSR